MSGLQLHTELRQVSGLLVRDDDIIRLEPLLVLLPESRVPVTAPLNPSPVVLVVDDDPDILEALAEILEVEGFNIRRARNGQEALQRLEAPLPQLILLDLMMPVMDGWEFAQKLHQRAEGSDIPIIVLSADRNVGTKAKEIGAVGHLAKPFELNELLDLVRTSLSGSQTAQSR